MSELEKIADLIEEENPAYPFSMSFDGVEVNWRGMSLREHYAGLIMAGIRANHLPTGDWTIESQASYSVRCADALIAALQSEGGER